MKTILVTGGAGFIGSNFLTYFVEKYNGYNVVCLDKLTYAGTLDNLKEIENAPNYKFIKGDICDSDLIGKLFAEYNISDIIHFAAESHVDNSISGPKAFIETNINGTFNLLDFARKAWFDKPHQAKEGYENSRFLHVSTDEVYGTLGEEGLFLETTPYAPNSPYSASKAASDMLVRSYHHTYGMNTVITNCSNNYGAKQHSEKLIPTIIRKALALEPIPIYGNGKNIRDWLFVNDHCTAIDLAFHNGRTGETYNVGGHNERQNITIAHVICQILDQKRPRPDGKFYTDLISFVTDRAGHDFRYAIDSTKLQTELGWQAAETFDTGIVKTVDWYLSNKH